MLYLINHHSLYDLIYEEISRVAKDEFSEDGTSLYEAIVLHSADRDDINRLQDDAVNTLVKRMYDIVTILPRNAAGLPGLQFNVPDLDTSTEDIISEEISRFIVLNTVSAWFQRKLNAKAPEFAARSQVALDKAAQMLHTRKAPQR